MDTATTEWIVKGAVILLGAVVYLRVLVRHYQQMAESMADEIARAALGRKDGAGGAAHKPRVTLSPASGGDESPGTE